jgi:hypothetical protein
VSGDSDAVTLTGEDPSKADWVTIDGTAAVVGPRTKMRIGRDRIEVDPARASNGAMTY